MASDYIKNIILDEKSNKIIADIADGNVYPLTFMEQKELYSHYKSYEEKYGAFICGLVSGTLRCANESNKLAKLEDKQEVIPSELELHYTMETLPNKSFNDVSKIFYSLETITENKDLTVEEKKSNYSKLLNKLLDEKDRKKPIFTLFRNENPNIIVSVYPSLEANTYKDDVFLSYYFDIKNIETNYEKIYAHNGMMISYLLDDETRTKQALQGMEQQFIEDEKTEIDKLQEETEDLGEQG